MLAAAEVKIDDKIKFNNGYEIVDVTILRIEAKSIQVLMGNKAEVWFNKEEFFTRFAFNQV